MRSLYYFILLLMFSGICNAQERTITGTITDKQSTPLPGVNITINNTSKGTLTDLDGKYSILAQVGDLLNIQYVGFQTETIEVTSTMSILDIEMLQSADELEEVIVTAQGIRIEKKAMSYAVSAIQASSISKRKHRRNKKTIKNTSFQYGSSNAIIIRGNASLPNEQPLYIVDGIPVDHKNQNLIDTIDPKLIKDVKILKGIKSTTLYGQSGRHGCVLITTHKGNYKINSQESYKEIIENNFEKVQLAPLSTFSIDVDKASYSNIRRKINNGESINKDAIKIEEMINYFDYAYKQPKDEHPFAIHTEYGTTPWNKETQLVKIGLKGKEIPQEAIPASNLVFLIDVSGSMNTQNKLPLLKRAFKLLVKQLREKDKVSIVVYAGAAGVVLKPTSGAYKNEINRAFDNLKAGGSTAGGKGIELAYKIAQENFKKKGNNRVILATDGDFNVGMSSDKDMEKLIEEKRSSGVFLTCLGFGMHNYKDSKLEVLADKGNGNHAYIDTMQEAQRVLGTEFGGTLYTIAKDVKIQVEFNPAKVQAYRLIGYENRLLDDEDFMDDTKDAGELGSGHTVTALYEIIPVGVESNYLKTVSDLKYTNKSTKKSSKDELLTVKFRYKNPTKNKSIEMTHVMSSSKSVTSEDFNFAASVAWFGMKLRGSKYINNDVLEDIIALAKANKTKDNLGYKAEFIRLMNVY